MIIYVVVATTKKYYYFYTPLMYFNSNNDKVSMCKQYFSTLCYSDDDKTSEKTTVSDKQTEHDDTARSNIYLFHCLKYLK